MDKLLQALTQGTLTLDPEKARPQPKRTTAQLREIIRRSKHKPKGRKVTMLVEIDGEIRSLRQWAEFLDVSYSRLYYFYHKGLRGRELVNKTREA